MSKRHRSGFVDLIATRSFLAIALIGVALAAFSMKRADFMSLLASATTSLSAPSVLYFSPASDDRFGIGQVFDIDVNMNARVPVNAIGTTIKFPQDSLEIVGVSKVKSFMDLWTEETAIREDVGEIHFSGGTTRKQGLIGTGTALTLTVRTKRAGDIELSFLDASVYASDGKGTEIDSTLRSYSFNVPEAHAAISQSGGGAPATPPAPSPDLDDSGKVTIVDISIMITRMLMPYSPRFDLDRDGSINLSDLSIVLSKINQEM